jgi:hypothetical protein
MPVWLQVIFFGSSLLCAYHGYKRNNGSIGWALGWSLTGPIGLAIALAEGFAKPLPKTLSGAKHKRRR